MDEENLGKLLKSLSNCNYVEFVKIFSMIHGFDATFEFLRNGLTTIPFMAFKRKFWWGNNNDEQSSSSTNTVVEEKPQKFKRQAIRSTWEDDEQSWLSGPGANPSYPSGGGMSYDSDHGYNRRSKYQRRTSAPSSFKTQKHLKFSDLPYELIINIFGYLKTTDLLIASLVSHEWSRICFVSTIELNIDNRNDITDPIISKKIYRHSNYLKKIRCASPAFAVTVSILAESVGVRSLHSRDSETSRCAAPSCRRSQSTPDSNILASVHHSKRSHSSTPLKIGSP
ncbi:hypothetical protein PPL_11605 [Heterostelium album PN500]|uniref:F-box domain-containing protein n=1 Tax=Heterostelium pallidum (strain ATCC 26659 / Pp 5 / PN500) TaxID=670386 RepID=D3BV80_HETP5|nr:hypothetical protein PPL_11605 [Heterostelium album PN500]EFA74637.1 hypothetical protein PPL_11605 [Heterostelium album PN500]|eukprot:XP_020426771.1 hypothetical protein PPL_11605 [Heterostelium album PN500]